MYTSAALLAKQSATVGLIGTPGKSIEVMLVATNKKTVIQIMEETDAEARLIR